MLALNSCCPGQITASTAAIESLESPQVYPLNATHPPSQRAAAGLFSPHAASSRHAAKMAPGRMSAQSFSPAHSGGFLVSPAASQAPCSSTAFSHPSWYRTPTPPAFDDLDRDWDIWEHIRSLPTKADITQLISMVESFQASY